MDKPTIKGSQIIVELPSDWHKNNDLGFSIYSVCIPSALGLLNCKLNLCGDSCHGRVMRNQQNLYS